MEQAYEICFYGGLVLAILLLIATVVLFIVLKIPKVIGELIGVGDSMVRHLADEGIIKRNSHGRYLLLESVKNYILTLKVSKAGESIKTDFDKDSLDLNHEKAVNEHWKSLITEIKLQLIKGQVHKSEDVERVMSDMFLNFKNKMLALPHKLAIKLENRERQEIQERLREEIASALSELADYTPEAFYSDEHIDIEDDVVLHLGDEQDE